MLKILLPNRKIPKMPQTCWTILPALVVWCISAFSAPAETTCDQSFLDPQYFRTASPEDVTRCLADTPREKLSQLRLPSGDTPLHLAAMYSRDTSVLRAILRTGLWQTERNRADWSPLHAASAISENPQTIFKLISWGADPDLQLPKDACRFSKPWKCSTGSLHLAANRPDGTDIAIALLAAGADPEAVDEQGRRPLHYAALRGNADLVEVLLVTGATVDAKDFAAMTPLALATVNDAKLEVINTLLDRHSSPDTEVGSEGSTPLLIAAGNTSDLRVLDALVEHSKNICIVDHRGRNFLTAYDNNPHQHEPSRAYWKVHKECEQLQVRDRSTSVDGQ